MTPNAMSNDAPKYHFAGTIGYSPAKCVNHTSPSAAPSSFSNGAPNPAPSSW